MDRDEHPVKTPRHFLAYLGSLSLGALTGCSSPPVQAPEASAETDAPAVVAEPVVHTELRQTVGRLEGNCADGDICGFFLQVISPGSDPVVLTNQALKILKGKCGGHIIAYQDKRNVKGAGSVFPSAEEKRACELSLGRDKSDTDFPNALVWRVIEK